MSSLTAQDKKNAECVADELNKLAAEFAGLAAFGVIPGVGWGWAGGMGLASASCWYAAAKWSDVAKDPPAPQYASPVRVEPVRPRLPRATTLELKLLNRTSRVALRMVPYTHGLLQAIERQQGAVAAGDTHYARVHDRAAARLLKRNVEMLGDLATAMHSLSESLKDSPLDVKITHDAIRAYQRDVGAHGLSPRLESTLRDAGFTDAMLHGYTEWLANFYVERLWTTTPSYILKVIADILVKRQAEFLSDPC